MLLSVFIVYYTQRIEVLNKQNLFQRNIMQRDSLESRVVTFGDIVSYDILRTKFINKPNEGEFLFYSIILANKSHYSQAYFDVYHELRSLLNMNGIDTCRIAPMKKYMLEYLVKGANLGHTQSMYTLGQLYIEGKDLPKDTILGKRLVSTSGLSK